MDPHLFHHGVPGCRWLSENDISTLEPSWGGMTSLRSLRLNNNNISTLVPGWSSMSSLEELHLFYNSIVNPLPDEWSNMGSLHTL